MSAEWLSEYLQVDPVFFGYNRNSLLLLGYKKASSLGDVFSEWSTPGDAWISPIPK